MPSFATRCSLRLVFVLLGAALTLSLALLDVTVIVLLVQGLALPLWAVVAVAVVVVAVPVVAVGLLPVVRTVEAAAVQSLLGTVGPAQPARSWLQRRRTLAWLVLHLLAGAVPVAGVVAAMAWVRGWWIPPALVVVAAVTVALGEWLARLAPTLLGPSASERLASLQRDANRAVERNRIARELHDSVGHALSVITLQVAAARTVMASDQDAAVVALDAAGEAARSAAADLDHALGLLRADTDALVTRRAPEPDLESLPTLVATTEAAGLSVEYSVVGDLGTLPVLVGREAYRIVQEALTNAMRYSEDSTVMLAIHRTESTVRITAANPSPPRTATRHGQGLRGIRERVHTLGGTVVVGPLAPRQWELNAVIPLRAAVRR